MIHHRAAPPLGAEGLHRLHIRKVAVAARRAAVGRGDQAARERTARGGTHAGERAADAEAVEHTAEPVRRHRVQTAQKVGKGLQRGGRVELKRGDHHTRRLRPRVRGNRRRQVRQPARRAAKEQNVAVEDGDGGVGRQRPRSQRFPRDEPPLEAEALVRLRIRRRVTVARRPAARRLHRGGQVGPVRADALDPLPLRRRRDDEHGRRPVVLDRQLDRQRRVGDEDDRAERERGERRRGHGTARRIAELAQLRSRSAPGGDIR